MTIRPATNKDIPAIVTLLKLSLGESLMPKSEGYWRWKHVDNPFGPSPVLLAEEGEEVIGVRAFMRWAWTDGKQTYRAVRAVDTATHPAHQGKGIFKKLTLALLDQCKTEGVDFVFNTPNAQSRPGYLKMGWVDAGRLPIQFRPLNVAGMIKCTCGIASAPAPGHHQPLDIVGLETAVRSISTGAVVTGRLETDRVAGYLKWRYADVPVVKYLGHVYNDGHAPEIFIGRIKRNRLGNEFRVTDVFCDGPAISAAGRKSLYAFARTHGADYLTCSGTGAPLKTGVTLHRGPITTVRPLHGIEQSALVQFTRWAPGLGDLELF